MIDQGKRNLLGVSIDAVDYDAAVDRVITAAKAQHACSVSALAVHGVMTGVLDSAHRYRLNSLDLVVPDGQPVRWGLNWLHRVALADRVYGPALMLKICERATAERLPVFLFGGTSQILERLASNLQQRFTGLQIAGMLPSRFRSLTEDEREQVIAEIRGSGARLTFVGLGCPRQEVWVYELREALSMPLLAVGAAFNFHADVLAQAPSIMQRWGLEWLFRFLREPRRLWKRYLLLNPLYLTLLGLQLARLHRIETDSARPPTQELRPG